jgi:hypothetical protein
MPIQGMLKMMFTPAPGWKKDVETNGKQARAAVISDPRELIKGIGGYQGRDGWLDVEVEVKPNDEVPFHGKMKCLFSTAIGGMLAPGLSVNVRYDGRDKRKIILMDDVNTLLGYRVRKP